MILKTISNSILGFFIFLMLILAIRGYATNPIADQLNTPYYKENGPFELSPERGRFSLIYSLVENHSIFYSLDLARFITPDLGYWQGKYVSLFSPGVSFLALPGYLIGKYFGLSQVGSFAVVSLFALANFFLIRKISTLFGASWFAATLGAFIFLFATPAYAYSTSLYQHHITVFLMLLGIYLVVKKSKSIWGLTSIWFICASSALLIDNPNIVLMLPIGIAGLNHLVQPKIKISKLLTLIVIIIPLIGFGLFNYYSYGSPFRLSGTVPYVAAIDAQGLPTRPEGEEGNQEELIKSLETAETASPISYFYTRNLVNGLYIHLFSPDRGLLVFTPVMLFALFGINHLSQKRHPYSLLLLSLLIVNLVTYSLWGDPWGGWAFGSRYLIPGYAVLSIYLSVFLTHQSKNIFLLILFSFSAIYSLAVNTLGAITTSAMPPKVQIPYYEKISGIQQKYTYARNWDFINQKGSKSFIYQTYLNSVLTAKNYYFLVLGISCLAFSLFTIGLVTRKHES